MAISISSNGADIALTSGVNAPSNTQRAQDAQQAAQQIEKARQEQAEKPTPDEVVQAAQEIGSYLDAVSRSLQISVDKELKEPIVTVLDATTERVVRQIPSEEVVAVAKFLRSQSAEVRNEEVLSGILLNQRG
jgi:flagellar protein FlaG